jgi:hypothetical protein
MFGSKSSSTIAAESRRLADFELAWSNKLITKRAEIRDVEASLGDACNQPVEQSEVAVAKTSEKLAALHAEVTTIHRTIDASRQKRRGVLQELQATRATEFRREAEELRRTAGEMGPAFPTNRHAPQTGRRAREPGDGIRALPGFGCWTGRSG